MMCDNAVHRASKHRKTKTALLVFLLVIAVFCLTMSPYTEDAFQPIAIAQLPQKDL